MRPGALALVLLVPALAGWELLETPDENVMRGNQQYGDGHYGDAAGSYENALGQGGETARIHFDMGAALYKQANGLEPGNDRTKMLDRAEVEFRLGTDTADPGLKSSAYHNLGNTHFVRERWGDAIEAYKRALRANPRNDDARYNLELALRQLKKDQPPPSGGGGGQGGNGPGKNNPDGQTQPQPNNQGQPQGDPKDQSGGTDPDKNQGDDPDPNQGNQDQPQGQGNQQQDKTGGTNPDDPTQQPDPNNASPGQNQNPDTPDPNQPNDPNNTQQNQAGRNQGNGDPGSPDRRGQPNSPSEQQAPDQRSESERKMDELERRSLELRKQKLKNGSTGRGNWQAKTKKDW